MPTLDTNVLVRLLVADDPRQTAVARALVRRSERENETLFVPLTVALELEWVLRSRYARTKEEIVATFTSLLEVAELDFQDEAALERALYLFRLRSADFAECLHLGCALSSDRTPLITFDRQAARLPGTRLAEA